MTSFNELLPPCEKCGHRNPIGFGLEKQIRKQEEAKYLEKEKAFETKLLEKEKDFEAKLSEKDKVFEAKLSEKDKALQARFYAEKKNLEIEVNRKSKEFIDSFQEKENLKFQSKIEKLKTDHNITLIKLNTELNSLKEKDNQRIELHQKEIEKINMQNNLREEEQKRIGAEHVHEKELEKNKYIQENESLKKQIEEIKKGSIQNSKLNGEGFEYDCFPQLQIAEMHSQGRGKFKKDDHLVDGMKADAIYEETDENGELIFRLIFEMKSQIDPTSNSRKNSTFFEPLYQNKLKKNADIAVLVSVLEPNNEFYNRGIVPIHKYENMYVIRPQFIDCFVSIMRNIYIKNMEEKRALIIAKEISQDRLYLEQNINLFRTGFLTNAKDMLITFDKGIKYVDEAIEKLKKGRSNLYETRDSLKYAFGKVQDFTIENLRSSNKLLEKSKPTKN